MSNDRFESWLQERYDAIQQKEREDDVFLEQYYPANIAELAQLMGLSEGDVHRRIEYLAHTQRASKHIILHTILMFHRINWRRE